MGTQFLHHNCEFQGEVTIPIFDSPIEVPSWAMIRDSVFPAGFLNYPRMRNGQDYLDTFYGWVYSGLSYGEVRTWLDPYSPPSNYSQIVQVPACVGGGFWFPNGFRSGTNFTSFRASFVPCYQGMSVRVKRQHGQDIGCVLYPAFNAPATMRGDGVMQMVDVAGTSCFGIDSTSTGVLPPEYVNQKKFFRVFNPLNPFVHQSYLPPSTYFIDPVTGAYFYPSMCNAHDVGGFWTNYLFGSVYFDGPTPYLAIRRQNIQSNANTMPAWGRRPVPSEPGLTWPLTFPTTKTTRIPGGWMLWQRSVTGGYRGKQYGIWIMSVDGSQYWSIRPEPQTAAAKAAFRHDNILSGNMSLKITPQGEFVASVDTHGPGGRYRVFTNSGVRLPWYYPQMSQLAPISLPCYNPCVAVGPVNNQE